MLWPKAYRWNNHEVSWYILGSLSISPGIIRSALPTNAALPTSVTASPVYIQRLDKRPSFLPRRDLRLLQRELLHAQRPVRQRQSAVLAA